MKKLAKDEIIKFLNEKYLETYDETEKIVILTLLSIAQPYCYKLGMEMEKI